MKNNYEKYRSAWLIGSAGGIGQSLSKVLSEYVDKISFCDMKNSPIVMNEKSNFWKINCADDKQFKKFADESVKMFGAPDLMLITAGHVSSANFLNCLSSAQLIFQKLLFSFITIGEFFISQKEILSTYSLRTFDRLCPIPPADPINQADLYFS